MAKGWLDNYGEEENYNDSQTTAPQGFDGDGYSNVGRNYSPAWGGQFQMGGNVYPVNYIPQAQGGMSVPGSVGFSYARTQSPAPSNGPYAKKTMASAQNGQEMKYYQEGLDWKPKSIGQEGLQLPSVRSLVNDTMNRKIQSKGKEVKTIQKDNTKTTTPKEIKKLSGIQQNKLNQQQSEEQAAKDWVQNSMQEVVRHPLFSPGYFTPEGAAIGAMESALKVGPDLYEGNYGSAAINAIGALPAVAAFGPELRSIKTSIAPELRQGLRTAGPSFGSSAENISSQDLVNSINEQLAKGLGIKKQDVPLAVSLMKDEKGFLNLNTHIGDELVGSINLRQNEIRPKTFMENILGRKINTPIEQFDNTIGYSKYSDYPFRNMKRNVDDIVTETGEWIPKQYYNSGISGEFNSAINETLKSKGLGNLLSTRSGIQTTLGKQRWDKLVKKGLAEPIGDIHYKMKKDGGIIKDDRGQWDHPGKITRIKGGNITMKKDPKTGKALAEPLLGIADTGEQQWMYPGKDYNFDGANYVTEIPKSKLAKNGIRQEQKGLQNLYNLVNFTNYNKPTVGGWLNKYN